jgi:NitT/TauT family transport system ATP-binding protein
VRLADRVVVLRRRPGRIAAIVDLPVPRAERHAGDPALTLESRKLWDLIRADAEAADREMQDA